MQALTSQVFSHRVAVDDAVIYKDEAELTVPWRYRKRTWFLLWLVLWLLGITEKVKQYINEDETNTIIRKHRLQAARSDNPQSWDNKDAIKAVHNALQAKKAIKEKNDADIAKKAATRLGLDTKVKIFSFKQRQITLPCFLR
ncbi:MAG: hypothetical protein Q9172_004582 [Xanthocarpia lactea]